MRAGEERGKDVPSDPLKPLPQDQRQTGRNQQHPGSTPTVPLTHQIKINPLEFLLLGAYLA